jgi:CRP-like cAMP-binding protein
MSAAGSCSWPTTPPRPLAAAWSHTAANRADSGFRNSLLRVNSLAAARPAGPAAVEGVTAHAGCASLQEDVGREGGRMARVESCVTSLSWVPVDAMQSLRRLAVDLGVSQWDLPPPDRLERLDELLASDAIRFANQLRAWIEVEDGRVTGHGHLGRGHMGRTTLRAGSRQLVFPAVALPDLRPDAEAGATWVRFVQTAGGLSGVPLPRRVRRPPFVQVAAPTVWTTLALTIHADGSSQHEVVGASPFPRHWIYDQTGALVAKSGLVDYTRWQRSAFGRHTPWGDEESRPLVTRVETALERHLSRLVIDARPSFRRLKRGAALVKQGDPGSELFLLFEGVLAVEVDGRVVTEVGPGAIVGEMAVLEHDVMVVCAVPARLRDRPELSAALAAALGADPARLATMLQRSIGGTAAVTVAEVPVDCFGQIEPRLRGIEGLSFVRRPARGAPAGRRTATLRAVTGCRVAVVPEELLAREALAELAEGRSSQRPRQA